MFRKSEVEDIEEIERSEYNIRVSFSSLNELTIRSEVLIKSGGRIS